MLRQLKFRVWNTKLNRWVSHFELGELTTEINKGLVGVTMSSEELGPDSQKASDCVIEQFTGRLDREGKEIYEGDIVKAYLNPKAYTLGRVSFKNLTYVLEDRKFNWENPPATDLAIMVAYSEFKIIGDIHQNPELLKQ